MIQAPDAVYLDTTGLSVDETEEAGADQPLHGVLVAVYQKASQPSANFGDLA